MCNTCKKPNCNCGSNNHSHKRVLATIADIRATIAILNAKINEALGEINYPPSLLSENSLVHKGYIESLNATTSTKGLVNRVESSPNTATQAV